jgi:hypothetical protein
VKVVSFVNLEAHSKLRLYFVFFVVVYWTINISLTVHTFGLHFVDLEMKIIIIVIINFTFIFEVI